MLSLDFSKVPCYFPCHYLVKYSVFASEMIGCNMNDCMLQAFDACKLISFVSPIIGKFTGHLLTRINVL